MMNEELNSSIYYLLLHPEQRQTILMVHGFRGNHRGLLEIAKNLVGFRIILLDLPGHGKSKPLKNGIHNLAGFAEAIENFATSLDLKDYILLGHSFGALVAAQLAINSAKNIRKLILVSPVSQSDRFFSKISAFYFKVSLALPRKLGRALLYSTFLNRTMSYTMMKTKKPALRQAIYKHHLGDLENPFYPEVLSEALDSVLKGEILKLAPLIQTPTLIIGGDQDDLSPVLAQKSLSKLIKHSQSVLLPRVGHLTHLETPKQVAEIIKKYLS